MFFFSFLFDYSSVYFTSNPTIVFTIMIDFMIFRNKMWALILYHFFTNLVWALILYQIFVANRVWACGECDAAAT